MSVDVFSKPKVRQKLHTSAMSIPILPTNAGSKLFIVYTVAIACSCRVEQGRGTKASSSRVSRVRVNGIALSAGFPLKRRKAWDEATSMEYQDIQYGSGNTSRSVK